MIVRIIILLGFFLFFLNQPVSAHLVGQPPFFRINGVYSNLYPVPSTSLSDFNLPQDLAAENYLVNQNLNFVMETNLLPVPAEIAAKTKFDWDFGDGSKGQGIKNTHVYSKPGSYILSITAQYGNEQAALIQSGLINILPEPNYKLPTPVIEVNGQQSKDPLTDMLHADFEQEVTFDASKSSAGSVKIVSYRWDFGDQQSSTQSVTKHVIDKKLGLSQVFPVLRIKDANGFIVDTFVEIENKTYQAPIMSPGTSQSTTKPQPMNKTEQNNLPVIVIVVLVLIGIIFTVRTRSRL